MKAFIESRFGYAAAVYELEKVFMDNPFNVYAKFLRKTNPY